MSKSTPTPIILDCTLRDGGYYNNWDFNIKFVNKYLQSMSDTGINFVEIGFRRVNLSSYAGECAYSTDTFLNKLIIPKNVKLGVMINAKEYLKNTKSLVNKNFLPANLSKVNFVRIAINFDNFQSAKVLVALLKKLGYKIGLNLMQSHGRDEPEYIDAAKKINDWGNVDMLYFADSFGNMYPNDVQHIVSSLQKGWKGDLGFHSHNNKSLALINCIESLKGGVVWCDGTILGMGRGAGNVTTEGLILETNKIKLIMNQKDIIKVRVHDGIVGLLYLGSIALANQFGLDWIWIAVGVAVLQIISPVTKFCPVYTILNKVMPDSNPIQNGK